MAGAPTFGRYRVTGTLGAGSMGEVYAAVDDVLGREVAIKTVRADGNRFHQEARAIASLSHPGVVAVFDLDLAAEPPFLVMERVAGPSLKARIATSPLPVDELRALGIQIARALAAAHAVGIVHRDVKPANILAAGPGAWKLADFGVAHVPDSSLTMTGQFVGSPAYAPPEALVRGITGFTGDVFALGATLYEAATGTLARATASTTGLLAPFPPVATAAPHLPAELAAAIDRAVAFEIDKRPTAAELADALALVPAPKRRRPWLPWAIGAAVVVLVIAIAASRQPAPAAAAVDPQAESRVAPTDDREPDDRDEHADHDWKKIEDEVRKGHAEPARHKLDDWERRYGETPESMALRRELDAMPRGHGKKHKGD